MLARALPLPVGVSDVPASVDVPLAFFADCFAAFSANRFCLDAEGGIGDENVYATDGF